MTLSISTGTVENGRGSPQKIINGASVQCGNPTTGYISQGDEYVRDIPSSTCSLWLESRHPEDRINLCLLVDGQIGTMGYLLFSHKKVELLFFGTTCIGLEEINEIRQILKTNTMPSLSCAESKGSDLTEIKSGVMLTKRLG